MSCLTTLKPDRKDNEESSGISQARSKPFAPVGEKTAPSTAMLRPQLLDSSRGRIVAVLQRGSGTAAEIASQLNLTANAVRAQLTGMERDGVVRRTGRRRGTTRPFHVFELTPEVEQLLSRAYLPLLMQLFRTFTQGLSPDQVNGLMRKAGKGLADELCPGKRPTGTLRSRLSFASRLLNEQLGAVTHVERNGGYAIKGVACPLAALTGKHPSVCLAMEGLVKEIVTDKVYECCDRTDRPRCCFELQRR
jgi:predicted ArsR family transcriptional regulator